MLKDPIALILEQIQCSIEDGYDIKRFVLNKRKYEKFVSDGKLFGYDVVLTDEVDFYSMEF